MLAPMIEHLGCLDGMNFWDANMRLWQKGTFAVLEDHDY